MTEPYRLAVQSEVTERSLDGFPRRAIELQPEAIQYEMRAAGMQIQKYLWPEEEQNTIPYRLTFTDLEAITAHMQGYSLDLLLLRPMEIVTKVRK
uniref:Uncharacterized protein n=1 Tax=Chromera velia CCMP2878 TaxID=1169474 RepID=A0A0G4F153_9ALVE|eukprot:Cvel_2595.t1-p1 / transcript=Cvel_2595.t1 / gene=Cvel_2595 / organism=Chromera_velia_CCMP2878 / gene_product=hypothetical protein / transcript_product=hypothetical protein / location=Cvel_scaffold102:120598-120879(+) / protein_length=94 / sequence_SO=supercontig / SO=protein_coding / is_pseudo=false